MKPAVLLRTVGAVLAALFLLLAPLSARRIGSDCTYKGKKLWGKVKVVNSSPDLKVKIVRSLPDLKVKIVTSFADSCGKWRMVEHFPDLKVQFVNSFPDITIQYVDSFPGVR